MQRSRAIVVWMVLLLSWSTAAHAEGPAPSSRDPWNSPLFPAAAADKPDTRYDYPKFLADSYFAILFGSINYPFSDRQLQPGFRVEEIDVPHTAVQVVLFGHHFHKYFSGEFSYLRPVKYVIYSNVNGDQREHSVSVAIGQIVVRGRYPVLPKLSVYGETGVTVKTRRGFEIEKKVVVDNEHVASLLVGAGVEYRLNDRWDWLAGVSFSPSHPRHSEPETVFTSTGFRYTMRQRPADPQRAPDPGHIFPEHIAQIGYSAGGAGYRTNEFFSEKFPIFWGGDSRLEHGVIARYQQNVYHTRSVFSLDLGGSVGFWSSRENNNKFMTFSAYPLLRFTYLRRRFADYYITYSFAGPSLITKTVIDDRDTGTHFTFQDGFAIGAFLRQKRDLLAELSIGHYSNGNLFADNPGLMVPITFNIGYTF